MSLIVVLGPPGCGKGTQCQKLKSENGQEHLSTGDVFREEVKKGSELGKKAKDIMARGELVGDDIVLEMIKSKMTSFRKDKGVIIDGVPRTMNQAQMLPTILDQVGRKVDKVIYFDVKDDTLIKRITGRWTHPASGRVQNTFFNPPKVAGKDDVTGEPLQHRADDNENALATRLNEQHQKTSPLIEFQRKQNLLLEVNAELIPQSVYNTIRDGLRLKEDLNTKQASLKLLNDWENRIEENWSQFQSKKEKAEWTLQRLANSPLHSLFQPFLQVHHIAKVSVLSKMQMIGSISGEEETQFRENHYARSQRIQHQSVDGLRFDTGNPLAMVPYSGLGVGIFTGLLCKVMTRSKRLLSGPFMFGIFTVPVAMDLVWKKRVQTLATDDYMYFLDWVTQNRKAAVQLEMHKPDQDEISVRQIISSQTNRNLGQAQLMALMKSRVGGVQFSLDWLK